jgi:hypothetical protein
MEGHHLEADMFFVGEDGGYNFDPTLLFQAHKWCLESARHQLRMENPVIVSNTFATRKELKPYFKMAREFGVTPAVYLAQSVFTSIHDVPEEIMAKIRARFAFDISKLFQE